MLQCVLLRVIRIFLSILISRKGFENKFSLSSGKPPFPPHQRLFVVVLFRPMWNGSHAAPSDQSKWRILNKHKLKNHSVFMRRLEEFLSFQSPHSCSCTNDFIFKIIITKNVTYY